MGQKVHPTGIRLGIVKKHSSTWYAGNKDYAEKLYQDLTVRDFIRKRLAHASVSRVDIERPADSARITIHTARPGIVIGKKGEDVELLRRAVSEKMGCQVNINIEEIRKPELDAYLVAQNVAQQLERRVQFRRAMTSSNTERNALGCRRYQSACCWSSWRSRDCSIRELSGRSRAVAHLTRRY